MLAFFLLSSVFSECVSSGSICKSPIPSLVLDFDIVSPDIDESRKAHETPEQLVLRLAQEKAFEVAKTRSVCR
jgi:predicted house-cleaning NTP pyrophosphatase (Maf/HAM1 superfamily)